MGYTGRLGKPDDGGAFAEETSKQETLKDFWIYISYIVLDKKKDIS